jgi:hypothetical protein
MANSDNSSPSYQRAFDKIEMNLEEFDLEALRSARGDAEDRIRVLGLRGA